MNKRYFLKKRIFAVVFLGVIFVFSAWNFVYGYEELKEVVSKEDTSVAQIEEEINDNLYGKMRFIETYGFLQVLLDKRECNNFSYIKDENGFLHYASFYREEDDQIFEYAMRVKRLQDYVQQSGTKVLFAVPPGKYNREYTQLRAGMPVNDPDSTVDELMFYLNRLGVETLDLRESLPGDALYYEETFFRTDHHWTVPAAFYAMKEVVNKLHESFGLDLDPDGYYTDISNYDAVTYEGGMLGSMGRKTGVTYCGAENFTALWPRYTGSFTRVNIAENGVATKRQGSFVEAFMDTDVLERTGDLYSDSQYSLYLDVIRDYEQIINEEKPDGVKMFMIRDSYFSPVISFMMPMCGQIDAIWSLEESEDIDIERYVRENTFDYVIIEVYPYNINEESFHYFKEE